MRELMMCLAVSAVCVGYAADPDWPADFDAQVAAHEQNVLSTRTTSVGGVLAGLFDPRALTFVPSAGYGTPASPFEPRCLTHEISNCIGLDTSMPGFLLFLR